MKKIALYIILSVCFLGLSHAQTSSMDYLFQNRPSFTTNNSQSPVFRSQLREVRAVWLTTIGGIDWPHSYSQSQFSARKQQQEYCNILDNLCHAGINTVLIQTRIRATTIFQSDMEPWDGCLSGFPGKSPGYDALEFCIRECHKRGMKLHAWVVTIPVGRWNGTGCKHLRNTCPQLLKKIGDEGFMDPDNPGTATYLAGFCKDLASRYDLDGIHLDYCRYPDTWGVIKDKEKGRENITRIVRAVSDAVHAVKPWIQMSCSPVGKYADTKRQWAHGWNARDIVCQDVALWLHEGYMDAIYPMMYFKNENFYPFAIDWQERSEGKIVAPGLGIYFMHPTQHNWPLSDISREFWVLRQYGMGNCMFRSKFFTDNTKGVYDFYAGTFAPLPSLQPAMTWLSSLKPEKPTNLTAHQDSDGNVSLYWNEPAAQAEPSTSHSPSSICYNLYGSDTHPVDVTKAENLLAGSLEDNSIELGRIGHTTYYAVTATDRYGNESDALQSCSDMEETIETTDNNRTFEEPIFPYSGGKVYLDGTGIQEGTLIIVSSIFGNDLMSSFVRTDGNRPYLNTGILTPGHYTVHYISGRKYSHLLGRFDIPIPGAKTETSK